MIETLLADLADAAAQAFEDKSIPILQRALAELQAAAKLDAANAIDNVTDVIEDEKFPKP